MQKSVFLPLWDHYELYGRPILYTESFSTIESENLEFHNSSYERSTHGATCENDKLKKRNILQLSEAVDVLHVLSTGPDLSKINWALSIFPLSGKLHVINFYLLHKFAYLSKAQLISKCFRAVLNTRKEKISSC